MDLLCITDVSKMFGISSKTLRYYENVGILKPIRMENNKYRYYDKNAVERIKQILILRKMQISIKDIIRIYENEDMSIVVEVFVDQIHAIDEEVSALSELKRIVNEFLQTMLKNGITKISTLPLLYEEMDKQLEVLKERKPVTYTELSAVNERLVKPLDIRIVMLPRTRILTSRLKKDGISDTDAFWQWINDNHIDYGTPGSHTMFEQQSGDEQIMIVKISNDFENISLFADHVFMGGLFAAASVYVDEDIHLSFRNILKSFDDNKYYEIDYTYDGTLRNEPLIETIISPDELRQKIDIFVPIKKRLADIAHYNDEKQTVENITWVKMEKANPIGQAISVDLKTMDYIGMRAVNGGNVSFDYKFYDYNDKGEIELHSYLLARQLVTKEKIKIPFMVEVDYQIPHKKMETRICHDVGYIDIRFPDDNMQITVREPVFGMEHIHIAPNNIIFGEDTNIKWIVGEKYFVVIINSDIKYCGTNFAYMQIDRNTFNEYSVRIAAAYGFDSVTLKSIKLHPVSPEKKNNLKKGELKMVIKQSNNTLTNLHPLVTYHYGENYNFNACMKMLMEYVEPNEMYSYSFFAGISGDNFVQVYGQKEQYENYNGSLSGVWDGLELIKYVFGEIGYEYSYITAEQIAANKGMYIETVKAFIDKGIPVIIRQRQPNPCYIPIVGYEENGKFLLYMSDEDGQPSKLNINEENMQNGWFRIDLQDWIFIGAKRKETKFRQIFINALAHIAELLESPDKYGCSFGPRAFLNWADDIVNGRFDNMTEEQFDGWKYYSTYICNMTTNFCGTSYDFLDKIKNTVPELADIYDEYKRMNNWDWGQKIGNRLNELEGNFNVTLAALQDKERRTAIANELRKFAPMYESFAKFIRDKLEKVK